MNNFFETFASEDFRKSASVFAQLLKVCSTVNGENVSTQPPNVSDPLLYGSPYRNSGHPLHACSYSTATTHHVSPKFNQFANRDQTTPLLPSNPCYAGAFTNQQMDEYTADRNMIELFCWCPLVDTNGGCAVAGLCHTSNSTLPCTFTITAKVNSVTQNGRCVVTEDNNRYHLHGGICWSIYTAVTLDMAVDSLPSDIAGAFSSGFPMVDWQGWIHSLFIFITGSGESVTDRSPTESCTVKECSVRLRRVGLSRNDSRIPSPDLDDSTVDSSTTRDLLPPRYKSKTTSRIDKNIYQNNSNNHVPPRNKYSESGSDCSTYDEAFNAWFTSVRPGYRKRRTLYDGDSSQLSCTQETDSQTEETVSSLKSPTHPCRRQSGKKLREEPYRSHRSPIHRSSQKSRMPDENVLSKSIFVESDRRRSGSHRKATAHRHRNHKRHNKHYAIEDQYRLYTASGQILDARKLPSTRSGRLVIPTLDLRFGQKLEIERNRVVSVQHDLDETASWILRRCNEPIPR